MTPSGAQGSLPDQPTRLLLVWEEQQSTSYFSFFLVFKLEPEVG